MRKISVIGIVHLAVLVVFATSCDESTSLAAEPTESKQVPAAGDLSNDPAELGGTCATVYWDVTYGGGSQTIPDGAYTYYIGDYWNDEVSSMKVRSGCALNVWIDANFSGEHKTLAGKIPWIGGSWNDQISAWTCNC